MKNIFKKTPAILVVALIIVLTVAFTVLAATVEFDFTGDGALDNQDIIAVMKSITGKEPLSDQSLADYDKDGKVNVLDVIAIKRYMFFLENNADGWTRGIY